MFDGQMEMSFGRHASMSSDRRKRQKRARWWFERMRQIVDLAIDWQPSPPPRPVQIWFPAAGSGLRRTALEPSTRRDEQHICE